MTALRGTLGRTNPCAVVAAMICFLSSVLSCSVAGVTAPEVKDGRLDLSGWDFEADGDVALLGTWEVCWNQLIEPGEHCRSNWRPVPVRGVWNQEGTGSPFGGRGVATYRVRIALPSETGALSVLAGGSLTAHRLWIDGVVRGGLGVVGPTAGTTVSSVGNRVYELTPTKSTVEFQIQVSNFEFRGGGLRRLWFIGRTDSIHRGMGLASLREGTLFAVGVIVGLGFLALFALRPSEQARGYFGMMVLAIGLRAVPSSITTFGELVAPWMTWSFIIRAEYLGAAIAGFAFVGYVRTKVAGTMPPKTMNGLQFVATAFGVIVAFAPMPIALATLPVQWVFSIVLIGLIILCYGRAWLRGAVGVGVTALTAVLYAGFAVHDIVRSYQSGLGLPIELFPYALVLWIFAEAYQILKGFHQAYDQVESLSDELSDANFELQETEAAIVRFVPFDFLRSLGKQSIRDVQSGDHGESELSVLYCGFVVDDSDVQGHGKVANDSDGKRPGTAFQWTSELVQNLEPCVDRNAGFLNDYRAEGFHAFFPGGPPDAVAAAVEIIAAIREFNAQAESTGRLGFEVGIGIDTGSVALGTIGSGEHLVRGVMGGPIDAAHRLRVLAPGLDAKILVSASTRKGLGDSSSLQIRGVGEAEVEAGKDPIEIFSVRYVSQDSAGM